jgi:hypothetical protein
MPASRHCKGLQEPHRTSRSFDLHMHVQESTSMFTFAAARHPSSSDAGEFRHSSMHPGYKPMMGAGSIRPLLMVLQVSVIFLRPSFFGGRFVVFARGVY